MNNDTNPAGWEERLEKEFHPLIVLRAVKTAIDLGESADITVTQTEHCEKELHDFIREEITTAFNEGRESNRGADAHREAFKAGQRDLLEKVKERVNWLRKLPPTDKELFIASLEDLSKEL